MHVRRYAHIHTYIEAYMYDYQNKTILAIAATTATTATNSEYITKPEAKRVSEHVCDVAFVV